MSNITMRVLSTVLIYLGENHIWNIEVLSKNYHNSKIEEKFNIKINDITTKS